MTRWNLLTASLALAVVLAAPVQAQPPRNYDSTTRGVEGTVTENGAKANGAVVQLKDTKTLQVRSFITKQDGLYHFFGLSTNTDYELRAEHNGAASSTKRLSVFDSHKLAVIDLKLNR